MKLYVAKADVRIEDILERLVQVKIILFVMCLMGFFGLYHRSFVEVANLIKNYSVFLKSTLYVFSSSLAYFDRKTTYFKAK